MCQLADLLGLYFEHHYKFRTILNSLKPQIIQSYGCSKLGTQGNDDMTVAYVHLDPSRCPLLHKSLQPPP